MNMKWIRGLIGLVLMLAMSPTLLVEAQTRLPGRLEVGVYVGPQSAISGVGEVGFSWVKYRVELTRDNSADVVARIAAANKLGLKVLLQVMGNRARAGEAAHWKEYAAQVATLAQANPNAIEVWHWPNLDRDFGGNGQSKVNPESYVGLLREAYTAIRGCIKSVIPSVARNLVCRFSSERTRCLATLDMTIGLNLPDQRKGGPTGDHPSWYFLPTIEVSTNPLPNGPMDGSVYSLVRPDGSCVACVGLRGVLLEGKTAPFG